MPADIYLSDEHYREALKNVRDGIASGVKLVADDDTTPGNKSTTCSWGLCSNERRIWPKPEMQLFGEEFPQRVAPKYLGKEHKCAMDRRTPEEAANGMGYGSGCFYSCRIFKRKKGEKLPTKEEALALFDATIAASKT